MRSRGNEFLPKAKTRRASVSVVQSFDFARGLIKKRGKLKENYPHSSTSIRNS